MFRRENQWFHFRKAWDLSTGRIQWSCFAFQPNCQVFGLLVTLFSLSGFLHLLRPLLAWLAILLLLLEGHWSVLSADLECLRACPPLPCPVPLAHTPSLPVGCVLKPHLWLELFGILILMPAATQSLKV